MVQVQRFALAFVIKILRDADSVFVQPCRHALIANSGGQDRRDRRRVWKLALILVFRHVLRDKAPFSVCAAWVLDCRVHVDAERVADAHNPHVLVESFFVAVFRNETDIAFAVGDLVVAGCVVSYVSVGHILDVPHDAVKDCCHFNVSIVIDRDYFTRRAVLTLFVRHLTDVLRQFVNCQAGTRVNCLALHRTAGCQHVSGPLPLVVRAAGHEPKVVQFVFAAVRIGCHRHL